MLRVDNPSTTPVTELPPRHGVKIRSYVHLYGLSLYKKIWNILLNAHGLYVRLA